jgi:hypothetical protein
LFVQDFDVAEHLDPIGGVPPRHDQPQREVVQERELLVIHGECNHHFAVAGMIDIKRLPEVGSVGYYRFVQPVEANLYRAWFDAGAIQHVLEADAGPFGITHRAVRPLRTCHARPVAPRIAGALIDWTIWATPILGRATPIRQRLRDFVAIAKRPFIPKGSFSSSIFISER